jgi:CheY-like chemotaxis protein
MSSEHWSANDAFAALHGLRVLAVEDEPILLMTLEDMLSGMGCRVVATAASVADATRAVRDNRFDLAVLDVSLAGEQIDPVAHEIRALQLPIVFATGHRSTDLALRFGADCEVIEKPFTADTLSQALLRGCKSLPGVRAPTTDVRQK